MSAGKLTKFSIFCTWLCCKFRSRRRSSPSSKGMCVRSRLSRFSRSGFAVLSEGFLYTTSTPGIYGNSAKIILSSSSTLRTIPFFSKYLYRSSSSLAESSIKRVYNQQRLREYASLTFNIDLLIIRTQVLIASIDTNIWYRMSWSWI